jgi:hypothetical protein
MLNIPFHKSLDQSCHDYKNSVFTVFILIHFLQVTLGTYQSFLNPYEVKPPSYKLVYTPNNYPP